ncbi:protein kinase domain-containing protein [Haliangium sp.]|uniref:serine/threonine-protein kinase n=1 Tax=Haliangium sp. TaxID=2663208 RepID=UPI003D101D33
MQLPAGLTIGQYELIRPIGHGGMGEVYQARDLRLARLVAIKFLNKSTPEQQQRFLVEARATARCTHENIVVIHEVGEYEGCPYLVLEYLQGQTLRAWWHTHTQPIPDGRGHNARSRLPPRRVIELMVPVVRALVCAHAHGIVHRDLKPENIMLTGAGATKVLDFGIAKELGDDAQSPSPGASLRMPSSSSHTGADGIIGTLPYMSPEQLEGERVDHRTDLWAVGIILFELALGQHPLPHHDASSLFEIADIEHPMPSAVARAPELGALATVIDRCLIKYKDDRIDSAATLLAELEAQLPTRASLAEDRSPFAGLAAFQEQDADRFFGRDRDVAALLARVRSQALVTVLGPSGAGKSSLVRAGLLPALESSGEGWAAHIVRPGRTPLSALAGLLATLAQTTSSSLDIPIVTDSEGNAKPALDEATIHRLRVERLHAEPGAFGAALRAWARRKRRQVLVFVDQFEELYTLGAEAAERAAFTACLDGAADDAGAPVRVVLSLRSDFLDHMIEHRSFIEQARRGLCFVKPLDRDGLREALIHPVEAANHHFEDPSMVEEMLDALDGTAGALPLLQFAADALWSRRDARRRLLTRASYEDMGGVAGALARHADAVLAAMSPTRVRLARSMFERLVTPEGTRALASLRELRALANDERDIDEILDELTQARLLVIKTESATDGSLVETSALADRAANTTIEMVHESLIEGWPTLRRWLADDRDQAAFLARLRTAAAVWYRGGKAEGLLWRDEVAQEARAWHRQYIGPLSTREQQYLHAVFALADRTQRRRRRLAYGIIAGLTLLALAAVTVVVIVTEQNQTIRAQLQALQESRSALDLSRRQQQEASGQAQRARRQVEAQRATVEQSTHRARQAEVASEQAEAARQRAFERAQRNAEAERQARYEAEIAQREAERAQARAEHSLSLAERAQTQAERAQAQAEAALDRERRAREQAEALLDKERARRKRLERALGGDLVDLPSTPAAPPGD